MESVKKRERFSIPRQNGGRRSGGGLKRATVLVPFVVLLVFFSFFSAALVDVGEAKVFRRIPKSLVFQTLVRRRDNAVALFSTQWDGTANKIAEGIEDTVTKLMRKKGNHTRGLRDLRLLRYDITFKDLERLQTTYGLQFEPPEIFYFRNGSAYTFPDSSFEGLETSFSRIGTLATSDIPLEKVRTMNHFRSILGRTELTFVLVDGWPNQECNATGDSSQVDPNRAAATAQAHSPLMEQRKATWDVRKLEGLIRSNKAATKEFVELDWEELSAMLDKLSDEAAKRGYQKAYGQFLELGRKNLFSSYIGFCYAEEIEVLPPDVVAETAEYLRKDTPEFAMNISGKPHLQAVIEKQVMLEDAFMVLGFDGETIFDVFTSDSQGDLLTWMREKVVERSQVDTLSDVQFWNILSEQMEMVQGEPTAENNNQAEESSIQYEEGNEQEMEEEEKKKKKKKKFLVVLIQADQENHKQAKESKYYSALEEAAAQVAKETDPQREYAFYHVPYTEEIWRGSLPAMLELTHFPCVMMFDMNEKLYYNLLLSESGEDGAHRIMTFVRDPGKPYVRSEVLEVPEDNAGNEVRATNVEAFQSSSPESCDKGVIDKVVLFQVKWCIHCKRALKVFEEASRSRLNSTDVDFFKLDCDRNDCYPKVFNLPPGALDKLPQVVAFPCKGRPIVYGGYRSVPHILNWLNSFM